MRAEVNKETDATLEAGFKNQGNSNESHLCV